MVCAIVCMHARDYQVYMPVHGRRKARGSQWESPFLAVGRPYLDVTGSLPEPEPTLQLLWLASIACSLPSALLSSSCLHSECSPCAGSPGLQCIFHQLHRACRCQFPLLLWFVKQAFVLSLFPMCVVNCSLNYAESWKLEKRKTWSMVPKPLPQRLQRFNSSRH